MGNSAGLWPALRTATAWQRLRRPTKPNRLALLSRATGCRCSPIHKFQNNWGAKHPTGLGRLCVFLNQLGELRIAVEALQIRIDGGGLGGIVIRKHRCE